MISAQKASKLEIFNPLILAYLKAKKKAIPTVQCLLLNIGVCKFSSETL